MVSTNHISIHPKPGFGSTHVQDPYNMLSNQMLESTVFLLVSIIDDISTGSDISHGYNSVLESISIDSYTDLEPICLFIALPFLS